MAVRVVTDSTSDLPADLADDLGITLVPASVYFGTRGYKDGVDITADEFFDKLMNGPDFPTTSQPSVGEFSDTYASVSDGADGIVSVHVSSKVSGTFNSAQQGAEHANVGCAVEVLDTLQASMGVGLVAIAAAQAAQAGGSIEEVDRRGEERDRTLPMHGFVGHAGVPAKRWEDRQSAGTRRDVA